MNIVVQTILADGSLASVSAALRARNGRADVKCVVADARVAARMAEVVRLARHTEARLDSRAQVILSLDRVPGAAERDWELAAVLADRLVRGLWRTEGQVVANGWSEQWQLGRIGGHDVRAALPSAILGGELRHLGALTGHPDPCASVASARAWFPLHSGGIHDCLGWVEVSVYPLDMPGLEEEETIAVPQLDAAAQHALRVALATARRCDARASGRWRSVVSFSQPRFQGDSFQLALVMADRIARGRELLPRGRIIASGMSSAWHLGRVEAVEACAAKCALIGREALAGDRILLPRAWEDCLPDGFRENLLARGASLALVERIGII